LNKHASSGRRQVAHVLEKDTAEFLKQSLARTPKLGAWTKLYAASQTLLSAMREDRVVAALFEIGSNLLGCEELAIVEIDHHTGTVHFLGEQGLLPEQREALIRNESIVEARITPGSAWVLSDSWQGASTSAPPGISALVPLWREQGSSGALLLFELLPQRSGFDAEDREVLQLLSLCAGPCLRSQTRG